MLVRRLHIVEAMLSRRRNVLVVEDAAIVRSVVASTLGAARYEVHECTNGLEALVLLEHFKMDAMVMDFDVPLLGGAALVRALKAMPAPHPPVLILAAPEQGAQIDELLETGRVEWLAKPFDPEELRRAVARLLPSRPPPPSGP